MQHTFMVPLLTAKAVAITFLTDGVALNFFDGGDAGYFHVVEAFFGFGCRMINPCFISCNSAVHKLLSLIGVTCQVRKRELCDLFRFFGTHHAHTCL